MITLNELHKLLSGNSKLIHHIVGPVLFVLVKMTLVFQKIFSVLYKNYNNLNCL